MIEDKNKFIRDFFEEHKVIFKEEDDYIETKLMETPPSGISKSELIGILYNRIRNALIKYVDSEEMTAEDFSNALSIMIKNNILFTYFNLEKTDRAIKMGMYDEELGKIKSEIEMSKIDWGDDIWGM